MIAGFVRGQTFRLSVPRIAADTIDYLTAKFLFQSSDWDGLEKWAHFALGDAAYDIRLTDDEITADSHLNLTAGKWTVYLHGNRYAEGKVVQRVTTETQTLDVLPTGTLDGEPFPTVPPSAGEQIIASAEAAEAGAKAAAAEARQAADEAAQYEPEVFWAEYGVTAFADVAAAYDAGKLCGVRYLNLRFIAARTSYATERFIEFTGTSYYRDHYMIRVTASDRWSIHEEELLTRRFDVAENIEVDPDSTEVPTVKAVYEAIQTYSDPAIVEALRKAKESGEFDGEPGENGITPHIGANGNWYIGETDTGIAAQGNPGRGITSVERTSGTGAAGTTDTYTITYTDGTTSTFGVYNGKNGTKGDKGDDYVLTDADKQEIAGMIPGGGGGSGNDDLIVTITNSDGTYTADHTYTEIETAINAKRRVRVFDESSLTGKPQEYPLYSAGINSLNGQFIGFSYISGSRINSYEYFASGEIRKIGSEIVPKYRGATEQYNGVYGYVPAATAGQQDYIFHGDGAWRKPVETISSASANTDIPTAKAVYDAIQAAIPGSGDNSGGSAGMVVFTVAYIDGQIIQLEDPVVYPGGANPLDLLMAGQARMVVITPSSGEGESVEKIGVLEFFHVDISSLVVQFVGTITGVNGNEAVMVELSLEANETTIVPIVQNSAGSGSSGGGGVVTITDNGDGTYSSSHTPAEIAAMAETGAVVAVMENALGLLSAIPLYMCVDEVAVFKDFDIDEDIADTKKILVNSIVVMESSVTVNISTIGNMDGASASVGGNNGFVPAPAAGEQNMVLHGDGTWRAALSEEDKMELVTRVLEKLPTWEGGTY